MVEQFGRWEVIEEAAPLIRGNGAPLRRVVARCSCGTERLVLLSNLRSGKSKSCGCFRVKRTTEVKARHGHARKGAVTPIFVCWQAMIARCTRKKHPSYANYGGRGINVCDRWLTFENFLQDMGERPSVRHSLDRIDVNGDYEPANCRWATRRVQRLNQRPRLRIEQFTDEQLIAEANKRGLL